ncbi:MAG: NAD(P)-dependent oxidoreductase [Polyangiaceae bacterium]|nr:NAD(P)-dependent oxidoreductase [Polyangiaceae bacterium]
MSKNPIAPVLIVGGSGVVGARAAKTLRKLQPDLPITIGGRDLAKASAVAKEIGHADASKIDLERADLGQPRDQSFSAVVMFVKDDTLHSMKYAQSMGAAYIGISTAAFEIAPEVGQFAHAPASAPILMASNWLAGSATLATLHFAREFQRIDTIEIGAVLDEQDIGGPAATIDYERQTTAAPNALILDDGKWIWATGAKATREFTTVDGATVRGQAYSLLDALSLATATDARSVRFDVVIGESAGRRRGAPFSTEIIVEIAGTKRDGSKARVRHELSHPEGQAPMTAVGVAVAVERLLGLTGGPPVQPALYLPNLLIDPETMMRRLSEFGAHVRRV